MKEHLYTLVFEKDKTYLIALCRATSHVEAQGAAIEHLSSLPGYTVHSIEHTEVPAVGMGVVELFHKL